MTCKHQQPRYDFKNGDCQAHCSCGKVTTSWHRSQDKAQIAYWQNYNYQRRQERFKNESENGLQ